MKRNIESLTKEMTDRKNEAISKFKQWVVGAPKFKVERYNFGHTHDGFSITRKDGNSIQKYEVDIIDTYCHVTHNFTWSIFNMPVASNVTAPSFEIQCFY